MVRVEIRQSTDDTVLATIESNPSGIVVSGPWERWLDLSDHIGLPSGQIVSAESEPDEWTRGLIVNFRSADVTARIVHDDDPLPESEPIDLRIALAV
jgi:hypothetical protein